MHIGGHIAFDVERIADYCRDRGIFLSRTAPTRTAPVARPPRPGTWGDAGVYSLYATKTISTGEGGVLVSHHAELIEYARAYRNYGKPHYQSRASATG